MLEDSTIEDEPILSNRRRSLTSDKDDLNRQKSHNSLPKDSYDSQKSRRYFPMALFKHKRKFDQKLGISSFSPKRSSQNSNVINNVRQSTQSSSHMLL